MVCGVVLFIVLIWYNIAVGILLIYIVTRSIFDAHLIGSGPVAAAWLFIEREDKILNAYTKSFYVISEVWLDQHRTTP